ncbi:MAG TPA: GNAT family protein [Salinimicrobium sp.]|nr:GNAT family protein [Salinimicrobium sp.]
MSKEKIFLRALEPEDLDFVYRIENNEEFWEVSGTQLPFSMYSIKLFMENALRDIYEVKQQRFVIAKNERAIGLIDLFDFDPANRRTGIGIMIEKREDRGSGYGAQSIELIKEYAFQKLNLHQIYANVSTDNSASIQLFEKSGFAFVGLKKEWNLVNGVYKDEVTYQLINKNVH